MSSFSCLEFAWKNTFCDPLLGGNGNEDPDQDHYEYNSSSNNEYEYEYDDEEDDEYLDFCNSNKIVELTIRRDFLLLKLQELVDAETSQQALSAVAAMNREAGSDDHLLKFLVRAGTFEILRARLLLNDSPPPASEPALPSSEPGAAETGGESFRGETKGDRAPASGPILSPLAAEPLLKKLSHYHEQRRLKRLENKRKRRTWVSIVGIS